MLLFGIVISGIYMALGETDAWEVAQLCFILLLFVLFALLELNITQTKIKRAVSAHLLSLKKGDM